MAYMAMAYIAMALYSYGRVMNSAFPATEAKFSWAALEPDVRMECIDKCRGEPTGTRDATVQLMNWASIDEVWPIWLWSI